MKRNIKIVLGITGLSLVGWLIVNNFSGPVRKNSNFKSYQQEFKAGATSMQQLVDASIESKKEAEKQQSPNKDALPKRGIAEKFQRENPIVNHLDQSEGNFLWSPDVFAILETEYKGDKGNIIGKHDGYIVVKDAAKPANALNLVYNSSEKRVGIFMGKIVVIHKKSNDFESKLQDISGSTPEYHSGVYFLSSDNLPAATKTVSNIQNNFKSIQVDLDVNYSRVRAN